MTAPQEARALVEKARERLIFHADRDRYSLVMDREELDALLALARRGAEVSGDSPTCESELAAIRIESAAGEKETT